ncbi:MAG: HAD family hydrolase [Acidimicrobiales bacterium]
MSTPNVRVVVFDFDGVCTPSHHEFITDASGALAPLRPGLAGVVNEIKARGLVTVLLSNEFDRSWVSTIEDFPAFDHVLLGTDNGICKPDRRAFQRVGLVTGHRAEECLVIDDDETNLSSAVSIGCRGVLFDDENPAGSWERVLTAC